MSKMVYEGPRIEFEDTGSGVIVRLIEANAVPADILFTPAQFLTAVTDAGKFWEGFQRRRAEEHIARLPKGRRRVG